MTARRRCRWLAVAAALALVAGCGGPGGDGDAPAGGAAAGAVRLSPTDPGPQGRVPQFVVECTFSHTAPDDPIMHPGHSGRSHQHLFFGNTTADADSTAESLAEGDTTCDQKLDLASYWAPALYDHGELVEPITSVAYYRPGVGVDPRDLRPYPFGLKMIGGDQVAEEPQPLDVVAWSCGTGSERSPTPPTCPEGRPLRLAVSFPDCWDGENLDSEDHVSHMARSEDGVCPDSHGPRAPAAVHHHPADHRENTVSLASGSAHRPRTSSTPGTRTSCGPRSGCLHRA